MIKLRFITENGKQLKPILSSIGPDQWLLEVAVYTFILTKRDKIHIQVLKTSDNRSKHLKVFYKKTLVGVASHSSIGTIFEYPPPKSVEFPLKLKQMPGVIYESPRKTEQVKSTRIKVIKKPTQGVAWKPPGDPEDLVEETYVGDPNNPFLTYYATKGNVSFCSISEQHMMHLPYHGWNVKWVPQGKMIKWKMALPNPIGVLHPTLYPWFLGRGTFKHLDILKQQHEKVVGFDVADSDLISQTAINFANRVDLIMVPSECSKTAYVKSGLTTNIEVVPHGLSELYSSPKNPFTQNPRHGLPEIPQEGVKILFFLIHSSFRKGADVVKTTMSRILAERKDVSLVVKGMRRNELQHLPRTIQITETITPEEIVRLYDSCDILLLPSRGGGLELNGLEALARGLILIASDWGAIQEYAEPYALTIKSKDKVKLFENNPVHIGHGTDPDPDHCYKLLNYALDNLTKLKKDSTQNAQKIRKGFTWHNVVEEVSKCLNSLGD